MNWYFEVWRKFAEFEGRSRRREYWSFVLVNVVVMILLSIVDRVIGSFSESMGVGLLSGLYCLAVLVPGIAVSIRRMHDTGRSGWWVALGIVPLLGLIVLFFAALDSEPGANRFGPNPKGVIGAGTPVSNDRPA